MNTYKYLSKASKPFKPSDVISTYEVARGMRITKNGQPFNNWTYNNTIFRDLDSGFHYQVGLELPSDDPCHRIRIEHGRHISKAVKCFYGTEEELKKTEKDFKLKKLIV